MSNITREDAVNWLTNLKEDCGRYQDLWPYGEALEQIIKLLDTDVAPVRHGRWESFEDVFLETCYECSECGLKFYLVDGGTPKENSYNYCPNCGARMDGESDE